MPVLDPINLDAATEPGIAPAVAAVGLARRYGQGATSVDALRGVDLAIEAGEMVAVMGPSGSGKSTLMHLLAGLDRPTAGTVTIAGKDITKLEGRGADPPAARSHRLRLPGLQPAADAHRRGERRPADPARRSHATPRPQARIPNLLDRVGLADRKRHRPAELSGGQQQRVAVARALVTEPAVVFADEPTGNLDSRSSAEVLGLLRDAASDFGRAVVMVTHDARAAAEADRVLFLADGLVVAERSHLTLRRDPRRNEGDRTMTSLVLKGIAARKLRTALTAVAIVLGAAMLTGTLIVGHTVKGGFHEWYTKANGNSAAVITGHLTVRDSNSDVGTPTPPLSPRSSRRSGTSRAWLMQKASCRASRS